MKLDFIRCQKLAHRRSNSRSDFTVVPNKLRSNSGVSQVTQWWRTHLPVKETRVWSLCWEDPPEKEMATCSTCLGNFTNRGAWQATVHWGTRVRHDLVTKLLPRIRKAWVDLETIAEVESLDLAVGWCKSQRASQGRFKCKQWGSPVWGTDKAGQKGQGFLASGYKMT